MALGMLKNSQSNLKTEIIAGVTTFLAMIYSLAVNADILSKTGMPASGIVTSTVVISVFACLAMGLYANNPYALAPSMGMNVFFSYTVVMAEGVAWPTALGAVFWSGVIFTILALFNIRSKILRSIPVAVKHGIGAGIGLFIALVGFHNAGFIEQSPDGLLEIASMSPSNAIFLFCLSVLIVLFVWRVRAAILLMLVVGCLLAYPFGRWWGQTLILHVPSHWVMTPDFALFGAIDWIGSLKVAIWPTILTFLFINIFDSTGTLVGLSQQMNWLDHQGQPIRMKASLLVDSISSGLSGLVGSSPTGIYVESATGIAVGGRTGIVAIVVALLFSPFLFLSPVVVMIPSFVVAPALVIVGAMMMRSVEFIDWQDYAQSIPAFLTIILMPLTLSIATGIIWGMVAWLLIALVTDWRSINLTALAIGLCCLVMLLTEMGVS